MNKPELLIPAGSLEVLKTAVRYGADAVYIGGESFGLRAKARNFSIDEMAYGAEYAHSHGVKIYVAVNILARNEDLDAIGEYLRELGSVKPDGLIIADPAVFVMAGQLMPGVPRHISTQANNTNYGTCNFWYGLGAKRIVAARELSLTEIREIREHIPEDMEIEAFIHGAMCISYSGRCLLSSFMTGRDANRGECTHPCRWRYSLMEESRPGEYMPVYEDDRGTYIFNSKDLCMVAHIPELIEAGIDSFKVEGRMKNSLYVATVARTYRNAIDDYLSDPDKYYSNTGRYMECISQCTYRPYTTGFFFGKPDSESQIYTENTYKQGYIYLGTVKDRGPGTEFEIEQKNKFCLGDQIEIMKPDGRDIQAAVKCIKDEEGNAMESCPHPKQTLSIDLQETVEIGDVLRMKGREQQ